ncbi:hypothetical protein A9Q74_11205 [Colwellia sp. 39_35_sub15_T18]|nr:hypothetical protein A9Q74_11205 [Colwellia sp. 39_35_sub15_T18]
MELLLLLLTAHFIGDFYLQPAGWVECRNSNHIKSKGLWMHFMVHTLLNSIVFLIATFSMFQALAAIVIISVSHLVTDYWKSYRKKNLTYFLVDQMIHLLIISIVWTYLSGFTLEQVLIFAKTLLTPKNMIIAISYLLVCKPASVIISLALKNYTDRLITDKKCSQEKTAAVLGNVGLVSAGSWIGYIERCLAISFVFMGQFAGIGFLVATKTIFRFGDLTKNKDMKLTEYMMLGTLLSYAIALFVGWNALYFYKIII